MKKNILLITIALIAISLNSCVKSVVTKRMTMAIPQFMRNTEYLQTLKLQASQKITNPQKFILYNSYMLVQDVYSGVHIIDISNISKPFNVGFIPAGNARDFAMKDNMLYLDCNRDLVTLNLSDINNIKVEGIVSNTFAPLSGITNTDSNLIFSGYRYIDTLIKTEDYQHYYYEKNVIYFNSTASGSGPISSVNAGGSSIGGSMARFCLVNNYLYTVDNAKLLSFNIDDVKNPLLTNSKNLQWGVETIYPMKDKLFIGSNTGMYMYNLSPTPANPTYISTFSHARVCDPVIADGNLAYVTLRSGTQCQGFTNQLDVVDISNMQSPKLIKSFSLTNPHGLSKKNNTLYICDGAAGLKVMDASNPNDVKTVKQIPMVNTFDVIATGNKAFVSAQDGIHIMDISNEQSPTELSIVK